MGATITYVPLPGGHANQAGVQPIGPNAIVTGPDGNLWMTETSNAIGRLTLDGRYDSFPLSGLSAKTIATAIAAGPDGNVWVALCPYPDPGTAELGRITADGDMTLFPLPTSDSPGGCATYLAAGPDGNVWFSDAVANALGRMTPDGSTAKFFLPGTSDWRDAPGPFTVGTDGNFWFGEIDRIAKVTTGGDFSFYAAVVLPDKGAGMGGPMVRGPDGALWWTGPFGDRFRRIVLAGPADPPVQLSDFLKPDWNSGTPNLIGDVSVGPDGNIWYATPNTIGCVTSEGTFYEMPAGDGLLIQHMTLGPDAALWFTQPSQDRLGRVALD